MGGYACGVRAVITEALGWVAKRVGDWWPWELDIGWQGGLIKGIRQVELW